MSYLYKSPIKMPRGTHYGSDYWIFYSLKLGRTVKVYSMLEYANAISLEMNPVVKYYCEQPAKVSSIRNDKTVNAIFDFWVLYNDDSNEFQEVKYSSELEGDDEASIRSQKQIEIQKEWCIDNNKNYRIVTERELFCGPFYFHNLTLLHSHLLRYDTNPKLELSTLLSYLKEGVRTIEEIKEKNFVPDEKIFSVLALLYYKGSIEINLDARPLDNLTEVMYAQ